MKEIGTKTEISVWNYELSFPYCKINIYKTDRPKYYIYIYKTI